MTSTFSILPSRPVIPHIATNCSNTRCNTPLEFPVPSPHPRQGTLLQIRCFACQNLFSHAFYPGQVPSSSILNNAPPRSGFSPPNAPSGSTGSQPRKGRKIGTQERPLETGYYDILGVPVNATTEDIKKSYSESYVPSHIFYILILIIMTFSFLFRATRHQASSRQKS
jgi:hypothetical protein